MFMQNTNEVDVIFHNTPEFNALFPVNHPYICADGASCVDAVVVIRGGFFITFGHAGFNSPTNNGRGYRTEASARAAIRKYTTAR